MQTAKITLLAIILCAPGLYAQLIYSFGSTGPEYGKASTVDRDTNYLCAALFSQTIEIDPAGTSNLTSRGGIDVAIVKINKRGELVFGKRFGGATTTDAPHAIGTDSAGNIYVAGYFGTGGNPNPASADFNPSGGGTLTTKSGFDAYLAKYTKNGDYLWALALGNSQGNTEERAWDIAVEKSGEVYVAGGFRGSVNFNPLGTSNVVTLPTGDAGLFLARYDPNGINQWVIPVTANDTSIFYEAYTAIDLDGNGNVVFAGNFRGANVNFSPTGTALLTSAGQTDIFFASYTSSGALNWVKRVGGTLQDIVSPGALRVDANNNIFFTGRIAGVVDLDPGSGTTNVSGSSLFLASYNSAGEIRFGFGMQSNPGDGGHRVAFDSDNNVYVSGWMNGTVNFNPAGAANLTATSPNADVFLAKYTNTGGFVWASNFGAANATDQNISAGLSVDQENNVIITGQFSGTNADFDPSSGQIPLSSIGGNDCFIAKYTSSGEVWRVTTAVEPENLSPGEFLLSQNFPNPFNPATRISFSLPESSHAILEVYDTRGKKVAELLNRPMEAGNHMIEFDAAGLNLVSGVYLYRLTTEGSSRTMKMILLK